ncbi:MAG: hypothetical protein EXQ94_12665 [Alphaproteobacteria bacterium]|nr:hypothetical protein [Alphaproteobacteria bacterium]
MSIRRATEEPYPVTQFLGLEDEQAKDRVLLQLGTPDGRMLEIACTYRAAHLVAAALGRWQTYRTADGASRKTAILSSNPGRLPCCP